MISCPTSIYHRSVHIYHWHSNAFEKKKTTKILSVLELKYIYIYMMESPLAMQVRHCLVNKNRCIPARQVTRFFQAPVQKGATPRGGCHPSQLAAAQRAAAQRAAAVFVLSTWPGRCQVQPPQGWFVGSGGVMDVYGGYICSCLTDLLMSGPLCAQTCPDKMTGFCGRSASISNELYHLNMGCFSNKDPKVHQLNRGVEP